MSKEGVQFIASGHLHQAFASREVGTMKLSKSRTMPTKLMDNVDREKAAIFFTDNIPRKEDMALVAAAKNGNRKAFEILVKRHEQRTFFVARRMTHTREDAEDVVQQSFQKAFTHLRT